MQLLASFVHDDPAVADNDGKMSLPFSVVEAGHVVRRWCREPFFVGFRNHAAFSVLFRMTVPPGDSSLVVGPRDPDMRTVAVYFCNEFLYSDHSTLGRTLGITAELPVLLVGLIQNGLRLLPRCWSHVECHCYRKCVFLKSGRHDSTNDLAEIHDGGN